jgi:hypothetical protein
MESNKLFAVVHICNGDYMGTQFFYAKSEEDIKRIKEYEFSYDELFRRCDNKLFVTEIPDSNRIHIIE